jgi:hypothetical protein
MVTAFSTLFIILFSAVVFLLFPRISAGFFPSQLTDPVRVSGFSKNVQLGEVGNLKISTRRIMRVVIAKEDVATLGDTPIYLRGTSFDSFDGMFWEKAVSEKRTLKKMYNKFFIEENPPGREIVQEFYVEPTNSSVLFAIGDPVLFEGPFYTVNIDRYGTVEATRPFVDRLRYTVVSRVADSAETPYTKPGGLTADERERYLQLPGDLDPRIGELARRITDVDAPPMEQADEMRGYLIQEMTYDLNPGEMGDDALARFLFDEKRGYCEHFATALVVLLRLNGIPSRLVTGFLVGNYNEIGSFYTVRASDAHAWVEAYFENEGWVRFDPTPPSGRVLFEEIGAVGAFFENLTMLWNVYVVNFEMKDQVEFIEGVMERGTRGRDTIGEMQSGFFERLRELTRATGMPLLLIGGVFLCGAVILLFYFLWLIFSSADFFGGTKRREVVRTYIRALRYLKRRGLVKKDSMTPREFSRMVSKKKPDLSKDIIRLTEAYYTGRYGNEESYERACDAAVTSFGRIKKQW